MRRSFGPMGGGGGGGAMMRTVHRAVRTSSGGRGGSSHQDPFSQFISNHNDSTSSNTTRPTYKPSSSDTNNNSNHNSNILSLSSSHHHHHPVNYLNNEYDDYIFATVPSMDEVNHALSSLQQVVDPPTNSQDSGWELDWIEPSTSMLQPRGSQNVYDAFRLLQTESSVQRMVVSLASDKSVWEAVMNNEAVRELRDSVNDANKSTSERDAEPSDGSIPLSDILDWIFINTKAKMMEVLEKTIEMVNKLFQSPKNEKNTKGEGQEGAAIEAFGKKLRSSFLMSVLVMLIVVVTRASRS